MTSITAKWRIGSRKLGELRWRGYIVVIRKLMHGGRNWRRKNVSEQLSLAEVSTDPASRREYMSFVQERGAAGPISQ